MASSNRQRPSPGIPEGNTTGSMVVVYGTTVPVVAVSGSGVFFRPSTGSSVAVDGGAGVVPYGVRVVSPGASVVMSEGHSYRCGQQCPGSIGMATHPSDGALHSLTAQTTSLRMQ